MEKIHCPEYTGASEPLDFTTYFKEYQSSIQLCLNSSDDTFAQRSIIMNQEFDLQLNVDDIKSLENLCTVNKLTVPDENLSLPLTEIPEVLAIKEAHPITAAAQSLETVESLQYFHDYMLGNIIPLIPSCTGKAYNKENGFEPDIEPGSAFTYSVTVYRPINTLLNVRWTNQRVRAQYDIQVLNTTTLVELANRIKCVSDVFVTREVESVEEVVGVGDNPKENYPSRCIFIENVFYNDMSHPNAIDYSEVVRKWAAEKDINGFKNKSMEGVQIGSLKFRLGYGYVYIHQGNCEHLISFSDAKLLQSSDLRVSKLYPQVNSIKRLTFFHCYICHINHASWLVVGSDRLPMRRTFFCEKCCKSYMFIDGKKIGRFQLYPYHIYDNDSDHEEGS
ncbi:snRNA-activating protein complex subunit 3 [Euwallacea similis]|uniref:snRNA-activating protein complex subunit 3 n=1 Tax=Euwallacea similis TaxID=1736056 RepID=UPI00344F5AB4